MTPSTRALLKNMLLMVGSMAVFLGLFEGILRLTGLVTTNSLRSPDLPTLESIPGVFDPDQDFVNRILPTLPYRVRTNSHGFRGPEFSSPKEAGVFRVLCVGDSYTLGPYVEDEETMPARLEEFLRRERPELEVINGGVNGFSIQDELSLLEKGLETVDPDLVVVAFSQNDIRDMARPTPMIELMREHAGTKAIPVVGLIIKFLQHTALFNGMQQLAARLKGPPKSPAGSSGGPHQPVPGRSYDDELWEQYGSVLEQTRAFLEQHHVPMVLVAWPSARQLAGTDSMTPQERLRSLAEETGVPFFDLTPSIEALQREGAAPFLVPLDGHPTDVGYRTAAGALGVYIVESGFHTADVH